MPDPASSREGPVSPAITRSPPYSAVRLRDQREHADYGRLKQAPSLTGCPARGDGCAD
jgi:hypothetical protein